uniref:Uncharacterized protein n=1 Tax=Lepeophtheirus salmonis TaxID=72036 RepID=A0A0K2TI86_LEPSM
MTYILKQATSKIRTLLIINYHLLVKAFINYI